jgi:hypothetical protein
MPGAAPLRGGRGASCASATNTPQTTTTSPGGDPERRGRAPLVGDRRRGESGEYGATGADAVDAERGALALGGVPAAHERHADGKRRAGEAQQEAEGDDRCEGVVPQRQRDERQREQRHQRAEHAPPAEPVGQPAERDAHERAEQHWYRDHRRHLEVRQSEVVLQVRAERSEQAPGVEAGGERQRGQRELAAGAGHRGRSAPAA